PFDQRGAGFSRVVNGRVDIGAFEMPRPFFTDDFERASAPSLGAPWVNQAGAIGVLVVGFAAGAGPVNVATLAGVTAADIDLYATVGLDAGQNAGLLARYTGAGDKNYYLASLSRDAEGNITARLARNLNGIVTELAVVEHAVSPSFFLHAYYDLRFRV